MYKKIANIITGLRVVCSVILLLCPAFSTSFYIVYLFGGVTDIVDGPIARKSGETNDFGARWDTIADFIFVTVSLIKVLPMIYVPFYIWIWVIVIAVIKTGNAIGGLIYRKKLISHHTFLNRCTGLLLFILPFTLHAIDTKYSLAIACSTATVAAIQETYHIAAGYDII